MDDPNLQQSNQETKSGDEVLATINSYLASKKYVLEKMNHCLNSVDEKGTKLHSNEPHQDFYNYIKCYYWNEKDEPNKKGVLKGSDLDKAIKNYIEKENPPENNKENTTPDKKDGKPQIIKKPDVFFVSDTKAAYIGEAEPTGGNTSKNYNINYISLGFLIDKILNQNIGVQIRPRKSDGQWIDVFNFVETPIKIVNSKYLISKNYSACLIPQIHPYSNGTPGEIKQTVEKTKSDGASDNEATDSNSNNNKLGIKIYEKKDCILWGWKDTIWDIKTKGEKENITLDPPLSPEADYVNLRYLLLNEQWITKLFNSGSELGKVLENIVNEIQSAVFGWWQLMLVSDNVNNNIKIVDTRGDIKDRQDGIFSFQLYGNSSDEGVYNSIIREVNIETQMSNMFAISALYSANEKNAVAAGSGSNNNNEIAINISNNSFNNMWSVEDKNNYSDMFLNDMQIKTIDYSKIEGGDDSLYQFWDKTFKSVYVAEDK